MTEIALLSATAVTVTFLLSCSPEEPAQSDRAAGYDRDLFGKWADEDEDCRNTRHEVLVDLSTGPVQATPNGCRILRGRWIDPYTGLIETEAGGLDVDHVLPLAWAWRHGAADWSSDRRRRFANDPANLVATDAGVNRTKGTNGPDEWLPPDPAGRCAYVLRIARAYDLGLEEDEAREIGRAQKSVYG